jgi:hypothetical protein
METREEGVKYKASSTAPASEEAEGAATTTLPCDFWLSAAAAVVVATGTKRSEQKQA